MFRGTTLEKDHGRGLGTEPLRVYLRLYYCVGWMGGVGLFPGANGIWRLYLGTRMYGAC